MRRAIALVSFYALTACGASNMQALPVTPSATPPAKTAAHMTTAQFTIAVPPPSKTSAALKRSPKYISSATESVIITLATVNGSTFTGSPASVATNLTTSNPACSSAGGTLTCTVSAPVAVGSNTYNVATYDAQQTGTSPASPAGNLLSQATLPLTVTANQLNTPTMPLVLNGVVASTTVTFASDPHISGTQAGGYTIVGNRPYTATLTALDADGNTIIGAGAPTFTASCSSSAITASISGNSAIVQVKSFSATQVGLTVTPSLGTATTVSVTTAQELWVATLNNGNGNGVIAYAITGNSPTQITADSITGSGEAVAVDLNGNVWVASDGGGANTKVAAYVPGTNTPISGEVITSSVGGFNPDALAVDKSGNLWVADASNGVAAYSIATNTPTPIAADSISTNVFGPAGLAFDGSGNLWVTNPGNPNTANVTAYNAAAGFAQITGDTIIDGDNFTAPLGVGFDNNGTVWVSDSSLNNVTNYTVGSGTTPIKTIPSLSGPRGLAFDGNGNMWIGQRGGVVVFSPGTGGNSPTQVMNDTIMFTSGTSLGNGLAFTP